MTPTPSAYQPRHRGAPTPAEPAAAPQTEPPPAHIPRQGMAAASALMAGGTMVSRVLGFVRTALLAVAIGATTTMADVFEKANSIPNIIYVLLAGGMFNVVLVPQLIKAAKASDKGAEYTSRLLTLTVVVLGAAALLITLAAYPIIVALTYEWSDAQLALGAAFALWTLPQIFFYGLYAVVGQILNANAKFGWYMWAPVLNNVIAIGFIVVFIITFGSYSSGDNQAAEWTTRQTIILAGGHTLGVILQAALLLWPLSKLGIPLKPKFGLRGLGLEQTGRIALWTLITMMVGNFSSLLHMRLVSGATAVREQLEEGAHLPGEYAANIAELIVLLPHSVFVLSLATVLFNQMTAAMQDSDISAARATLNRGLRIFAIPVMFSMVVFVVLAGPIGRLFSGTSAEAALAGAAIGQLLLIYAVGLPFRSAQFYLMRAFYAAEDAKTPMVVTCILAPIGLAITYTCAALLPTQYLPYVVVSLFSALNVVRTVIFHRIAVRRWGPYGLDSVVRAYIGSGFAAAASGAAGALVLLALGGFTGGFAWSSIGTAAVSCCAVVLVMGAVYLILLRAMKVREFGEFMDPVARRIPALARLAP
ncbi:murein biosynthesis integral membrane protein MurJ [Nesterenkonia sphaerica]|uniref:Murein biosynthesis integral membrane protein MurJ n=1 Tax=Nesterenkonia sphaerica TaxID=1804988 RepID=A0A5R9APH5_9MICC|nr:murein biosynthesis integral membrane protein MurJ [Nesterenkonia sphaerica]TLP79914.1 murein biosynthesis integral membrane protein MurJ [Nesterenkonia sphaerica]